MSKFGVAQLECHSTLLSTSTLPPSHTPPLPSSAALSACSIARSYFACRKVAPKCCRCLSSSARCCRVALSPCRIVAWLVGILNNLPQACKFPLKMPPPSKRSASKTQLGVYLIFHMPPQLLQHTARRGAQTCRSCCTAELCQLPTQVVARPILEELQVAK